MNENPPGYDNLSDELKDSLRLILALPNNRVRLEDAKCKFCKKGVVHRYKDDPRARGWIRFECQNPNCKTWGDEVPPGHPLRKMIDKNKSKKTKK